MAINDLYELKVYQNYGLNVDEVLNVYFFKQTSGDGNSLGLIDAYKNTWEELIQNFQSSIVQTHRYVARNLFNVADFAEIINDDGDVPGLRSGDALPVHDAVTLRLVRTSREVRNGYKRYAGIGESAQVNGLITATDIIGYINDLADALAGAVESTVPGVFTFDHVVVKRIVIPPDADHPKVRYRLPIDAEEAVSYSPADVLVNLFVKHQVSRGN